MDEQFDAELKAVIAELEGEIKTRVDARTAELDAQVKRIEENTPEGPEVAFNIDVDVQMKDVPLVFDLPSVTMKDQRIVFGLPEVTMRDKEIIFHTPSIRMVPKKFGQRPVWYGPFKMVWEDIVMDLPEAFMQEQRVVLGIPEFVMRDREFVLGVPEFTMVSNRIVLSLPQITVRSVGATIADMKEAADAAKAETEAGDPCKLKLETRGL